MEHPILPPELFDLVIGHLANDRATLIVASLTCRQFRHVCQRLLFTTYRLSIRKLEDDPLSPPERLLKTLETSPHLASCIHTLVVGNASDNESCESQDRLFDKLKLPLVYAQVKKLKRLEVNGTSSFRPTWSAIPFQSGLPSNRCDLGRVLPITHLSLRKIRDVPTSWLFTFPKLEELCMDWVATTDDPRLKQEFDAGSLPICLKRIRLSTTHPTLIQLILNNPNTFNLEALEELSIMENLSNGPQGSTLSFLATLPAKAFTTLQRLEIDIDGYYLNPNSISQVLDLRKFSSLRFLQVDWHGSGSLSVLIGWLEGFKNSQ
ncbi:hypothetical protein FA15DRAFT_40468 [Coprinopsis marcescibilis]|uniref:F-box domain-containing protein n=1 Tax=Coprinopsis marcescibilis TaxID=230819 RepID=A0A5C3L759_COPMA|nr:hypothetical protein FA15DRAFT_40468 [Coprinopsis marcescibilis]